MIDIAEPGEDFSVARFQAEARAAIADIESRGRRALLVGGTGLYLRAVVDDLRFPPEDRELRALIDARYPGDAGLARAYTDLELRDQTAASRIEPGNRRRIIRALEVIQTTGRPFSSFGAGLTGILDQVVPVRIAGLHVDRPLTGARIQARVRRMADAGLLDEVRRLAAARWSRTARQAIGYKEVLEHLRGEITFDLALMAVETRTRRFARRQEAWFRRDRAGRMVRRRDENPARRRGRDGMVGTPMTHFAKLHATGNDFLVTATPVSAAQAVALCDRFTGVGADGVLVLGPGTGGADATMTLTNADGSIAEMSGNGARCLAWFARRAGVGTPDRLVVDTGGGRRTLELTLDDRGDVVHAVCDMGAVTFDPGRIPVVDASGEGLTATVDGCTLHRRRGRDRQSALGDRGRRPGRRRSRTGRAGARARPPLPGAGERRVRHGRRAGPDADAGVGARRW